MNVDFSSIILFYCNANANSTMCPSCIDRHSLITHVCFYVYPPAAEWFSLDCTSGMKGVLWETGTACHSRAPGVAPGFDGSVLLVVLVFYVVFCFDLFFVFVFLIVLFLFLFFFLLLFVFILCLTCLVLPVSLDCPFVITTSVFSNVYLVCKKLQHDGWYVYYYSFIILYVNL